MSIVSLAFIGFVLLTLVACYAVGKRQQPYVLLAVSLLFYALYSFKAFYFLLFTSVTVYGGARAVEALGVRIKGSEDDGTIKRLERRRRLVYVLILVANLAILFFDKVFNFTVHNINRISELLGGSLELRSLNILMPLGISFYTFQAISYLIDVHRGKYAAERRYDRLLLFLVYFPQLIQGPINKYDELAPQLYEGRTWDRERVILGAQRMLWGYFKKLVIADRIAVMVNEVFRVGSPYEGFTVFLGVLAYSIQIYGDFSGGIDIVMGFSEMLGISMMENFKRPFFAETLSDFWQRWHVSLGTWMREYIFYPVAFSKRINRIGRKLRKKGHKKAAKVIPTSLSSVVVFFCVGLWHGTSWKYIIYGLYNGLIISSGVVLQDQLDHITHDILRADTKTFSWRLFRMLRTLMITTFGRYLSRAGSFRHALDMLKRTFSRFNPWVLVDGSLLKLGLDAKEINVLVVALLMVFVVSFCQERGHAVRKWINGQNAYFSMALYLGLILFIVIFGYYGPNFDASNFIYQGF